MANWSIYEILTEPALAMEPAINDEPLPPSVIHIIEHGLAKLGRYWQGNAARMCQMIVITAAILESTDLIQMARDIEFQEARLAFSALVSFLSDEMEKRGLLIQWIGVPLFVLTLALVRSGQKSILQTITDRINAVGPVHRCETGPPFHPAQNVSAAE